MFLHRFSLAARGISKSLLVFCPRLRPSSKRNVSKSILGIPMQSGSWRRADGFACWWRCPIFQKLFLETPILSYVVRSVRLQAALSDSVRFFWSADSVRFCPILSDFVRFCPILSDFSCRFCPILSGLALLAHTTAPASFGGSPSQAIAREQKHSLCP